METKKRIRLVFAVTGFALFLSACQVPVGLTVASLAASGISYLTTGKSVADHTLSAMVSQDCAMFRAVQGGDVCREYDGAGEGSGKVMVATAATTRKLAVATDRGGANFIAVRFDDSLVSPASGRSPRGGLGARYMLRSGQDEIVTTADALSGDQAIVVGYSSRAELFALVQDDGALEIFVYDPPADGETVIIKRIMTVTGYGDRPTAFSGLRINGTFHSIADISV